jgi:type I restriction enzyme R subunit
MFYKVLLPLLEFEREINTVDLSKVVLTHHHLRDLGTQKLDLQQGKSIPIPGLGPGDGGVQEKEKADLAEIIAKLNEIFGVGLPEDQINFACVILPNQLRQSKILRQQAAANSKQQFGSSPDFDRELIDAIIAALDTHQAMSSQALNSERARDGLKDLLLNHTNLYEDLRDAA